MPSVFDFEAKAKKSYNFFGGPKKKAGGGDAGAGATGGANSTSNRNTHILGLPSPGAYFSFFLAANSDTYTLLLDIVSVTNRV